MLPSDNVIALIVTVFPVPTFLLLNADVTDCPKVSDPTKPEKVRDVVAVAFPLYVLLEAEAEALFNNCSCCTRLICD